MPDDLTVGANQENPVVGRAGRALGNHSRRRAGAGHQGERAHALGIIDANDGVGREVIGAESERPNDFPGPSGFDDAVIELIGNENVAVLVERRVQSKVLRGGGVGGQQKGAGGEADAEDADQTVKGA